MQTRRGTSVPNTSGRPVSDPANNGIPTPAAIRREGPERRRSPAGSLNDNTQEPRNDVSDRGHPGAPSARWR